MNDRVLMQFTKEHVHGYTHDAKIFREWSFNTNVWHNNKLSFWEEIHFKFGYGLFTFHTTNTTLATFHNKRYFNMSGELIRIFDFVAFYCYGELHFYYVDKVKFERLINYLASSKEEIDIKKLYDMLESLIHQIVIAQKVLQKKWSLEHTPMHILIHFTIFYASLTKQENSRVMIKVGSLIRNPLFSSFFGNLSLKINWFLNRLVKKFNEFFNIQTDLLTFVRKLMYQTDLYQYDECIYAIVNHPEDFKFTFSDFYHLEDYYGVDVDLFEKKILNYNRWSTNDISNASMKLSSMLKDLRFNSAINFGVEPGAMAVLVNELNVSNTVVLFEHATTDHGLLRFKDDNITRLVGSKFITLHHFSLANLLTIQDKSELLISDICCCSNINHKAHYEHFNTMQEYFIRSKHRYALIKIMVKNFNAINWNFKSLRYKFMRSSNVKPFSTELYAYIEKRSFLESYQTKNQLEEQFAKIFFPYYSNVQMYKSLVLTDYKFNEYVEFKCNFPVGRNIFVCDSFSTDIHSNYVKSGLPSRTKFSKVPNVLALTQYSMTDLTLFLNPDELEDVTLLREILKHKKDYQIKHRLWINFNSECFNLQDFLYFLDNECKALEVFEFVEPSVPPMSPSIAFTSPNVSRKLLIHEDEPLANDELNRDNDSGLNQHKVDDVSKNDAKTEVSIETFIISKIKDENPYGKITNVGQVPIKYKEGDLTNNNSAQRVPLNETTIYNTDIVYEIKKRTETNWETCSWGAFINYAENMLKSSVILLKTSGKEAHIDILNKTVLNDDVLYDYRLFKEGKVEIKNDEIIDIPRSDEPELLSNNKIIQVDKVQHRSVLTFLITPNYTNLPDNQLALLKTKVDIKNISTKTNFKEPYITKDGSIIKVVHSEKQLVDFVNNLKIGTYTIWVDPHLHFDYELFVNLVNPNPVVILYYYEVEKSIIEIDVEKEIISERKAKLVANRYDKWIKTMWSEFKHHVVNVQGDNHCVARSVSVIVNEGLQEEFQTIYSCLDKTFTKEQLTRMRVSGNLDNKEISIILTFYNLGCYIVISDKILKVRDGKYALLIVGKHCLACLSNDHPVIRRAEDIDINDSKSVILKLYGDEDDPQMQFKKDIDILKANFAVGEYAEIHAPAIDAMKKLSLVRNEIKVKIIDAAPGTGKTMAAAKFMCKYTHVYVGGSSEQVKQMGEDMRRIGVINPRDYFLKTHVHAFTPVNTNKEKYAAPNKGILYFLLDEAFRHCLPYIRVAAQMFENAEFILLGGSEQIGVSRVWYPKLLTAVDDFTIMDLLVKINKLTDLSFIKRIRTTRRFGPKTVKLMKAVSSSKLELYCDNAREDEFYYCGKDMKNPYHQETTYLALSDADVKKVGHVKTLTICASQGMTFDTVAVYISKSLNTQDVNAPENLFVALTRHRKRLIIYDPYRNYSSSRISLNTSPNFFTDLNTIGKIINKPSNGNYSPLDRPKDVFFHQPNGDNLINKGMDMDFFMTLQPKMVVQKPTPHKYEKIKKYPSLNYSKFNFRLAKMLAEVESDNVGLQESMTFTSENLYNMRIKDSKMMDLNKTILKARGSLTGKRHFQKSFIQEINTLMGRLSNSELIQKHQRSKMKSLDKKMLDKMYANWFNMFIDRSKYDQILDMKIIDDEIITSLNDYLSVINVTTSDVEQTHKGILAYLKVHLKQQIKTKDAEAPFKNKGGQPIAAMEKQLNMLFSVFFRTMFSLIKKSLKDKWRFADGMNDSEIATFAASATKYIVEMDAPEYDASQSFVTQQAERFIWALFSFDDDLLDFFYMTRSGMRMRSLILNAFWSWMKPSGAVDTMSGNILLMTFICSSLFKDSDINKGIFKGDDSMLYVYKKVVTLNYKFFDIVFKDKLKVKTAEEIGEFCNTWYGEGHYIYNPLHFFRKLTNIDYTKKLLDPDAFVEFKDSLNNLVNSIRKDYHKSVIIVAKRLEVSLNIARVIVNQFEAIASLDQKSFISELQLEFVEIRDVIGSEIEYSQLKCPIIMVNTSKKLNNQSGKDRKPKKQQKRRKSRAGKKATKAAVKSVQKKVQRKMENQKMITKQVVEKNAKEADPIKRKLKNLIAYFLDPMDAAVKTPTRLNGTTPTGAFKNKTVLPLTANSDGYSALFVFRNLLCTMIYSVFDVNTEYSMLSAGDSPDQEPSGTFPLVGQVDDVDTWSDAKYLQFTCFTNTNGTAIHGVNQYAGTTTYAPDARAIWIDAGAALKLYLNTIDTDGVVGFQAVDLTQTKAIPMGWYIVDGDGSEIELLNGSQLGGYFAIQYRFKTSDSGASEVNCEVGSIYYAYTDVDVAMAHVCAKDLDLNIGYMGSQVVTALSYTLTNVSNILSTNGSFNVCYGTPNSCWYLEFMGSDPSQIQNVFLNAKEKTTNVNMPLEHGHSNFLKASDISDLSVQSQTSVDDGLLEDSRWNLYSTQPYMVAGGYTPVASGTPAVTCNINLKLGAEYETQNSISELRVSGFTEDEIRAVIHLIAPMQSVMTNDFHIGDIWKWIEEKGLPGLESALGFGSKLLSFGKSFV